MITIFPIVTIDWVEIWACVGIGVTVGGIVPVGIKVIVGVGVGSSVEVGNVVIVSSRGPVG